jgi:hypothetical protein
MLECLYLKTIRLEINVSYSLLPAYETFLHSLARELLAENSMRIQSVLLLGSEK